MRSINLSSPEGSYSLYFPPETNIDAIAKRSHPLNRVPTIRRAGANKPNFMECGGLAAALALATSPTKQIRQLHISSKHPIAINFRRAERGKEEAI
jgi:hypothetical protein